MQVATYGRRGYDVADTVYDVAIRNVEIVAQGVSKSTHEKRRMFAMLQTSVIWLKKCCHEIAVSRVKLDAKVNDSSHK